MRTKKSNPRISQSKEMGYSEMVKSVTRSQPETAAFTVTVDKTEKGGTKGFSTKYPSLHFNRMFII